MHALSIILVALSAFAASTAAQPTPGRAVAAEVNLVPEFRKLGLVPQAQGNRDVCSLFAVTALAEYESGRHSQKPPGPLSEEYLIWAAKKATGKKGDQAMFYEAFHGLETLGICQAALLPYSPAPGAKHVPSPKAQENARELAGRWQVHWIRRWNVARPLNDRELTGIKDALALGHPVACGLRWPKVEKGSIMRQVPAPKDVFDGHSIALVGYTDDPKQNGGGMFIFRNSNGPRWGDGGYGRISYAYVRAYANDALWLKFLPGAQKRAVERFEAESMPILGRERMETSIQDMAEWGKPMWGGGRQLFCKARHEGSATLALPVRRPGRYRLRVLATAAPDYGIVRAFLDGKRVGHDMNLYSGRVCPSGAIDLGALDLSAGRHALRFASVGKDPVSSGVWFGIDAVELDAD